MLGLLVAINRCGDSFNVNFSMFIKANLILVQFSHIGDDGIGDDGLNRRCNGSTVL